MLVTREKIAKKHGLTKQQLVTKFKKTWRDFPCHVAKEGKILLYDEEIVDKYIESKKVHKTPKPAKKEPVLRFGGVSRVDNYFGNQKFLRVEVNFETL
jgi:hypothetical protein